MSCVLHTQANFAILGTFLWQTEHLFLAQKESRTTGLVSRNGSGGFRPRIRVSQRSASPVSLTTNNSETKIKQKIQQEQWVRQRAQVPVVNLRALPSWIDPSNLSSLSSPDSEEKIYLPYSEEGERGVNHVRAVRNVYRWQGCFRSCCKRLLQLQVWFQNFGEGPTIRGA